MIDFPKLTAVVLGGGLAAWLGGFGILPLVSSGVGLLLLRRVLREFRD